MKRGQKVRGVRKTVEGSGRERMWRTMKMLKTFTANDLAIAASLPAAPVALAEAIYYVKWLSAAGYLVAVQPHRPGHKGRTVWRLVQNTGPKPPMVLRARLLWDPNLHAVAHVHQPKEQAA